jgi:hypothetical protein
MLDGEMRLQLINFPQWHAAVRLFTRAGLNHIGISASAQNVTQDIERSLDAFACI